MLLGAKMHILRSILFRNSDLFDPSKGIRILESKTFCLRNPLSARFLLVESGIVGFGIWNTAEGIWNPQTIDIRNPSFMDKESGIQYRKSGIHGVETRIQDSLGFPYTGRN